MFDSRSFSLALVLVCSLDGTWCTSAPVADSQPATPRPAREPDAVPASPRATGEIRGEVPQNCPAGMVGIPAGRFLMGTDGRQDGRDPSTRPEHPVVLSSFCMDRIEVSVAQYAACVRAGRCQELDQVSLCNAGVPGRENHPANCGEWNDAVAYCRFVGKRLPTEAQWEYAARGIDQRTYPWGDAPPAGVCYQPDAELASCDVGVHPADRSPFGVLDMGANVAEWTADWWGPYPDSESTDPAGPATGGDRIARGGTQGGAASKVRSFVRRSIGPEVHAIGVGFRCAAPVPSR